MSARILVVDDLEPNVKLLEAKLTSEYYDVVTAYSGKEALEKVNSDKPDIILLDVMMPEMDGFEVCRRLKADPETSQIPVVMVTALSEIEDRVTGLEAGADDFLTKPINDLSLFARIRSLVRLKHMTDELMLRDQTGIDLGIDQGKIVESNKQIIDAAHILIVDDDVVQAKSMQGKLAELGGIVTVEEDPEQMMDAVAKKEYDVLIISTQLTDADGLRLCMNVRNNEATRRLPLLMLIEEDDTELLVKGLDLGVNDYIMTPIDGNELVARVSTQIQRKRYQDALKDSYQNSVSMAMTDGLTNLYNRRYFDTYFNNMLDQSKEQDKPLALLLMDIDHFKAVNDNYGHVSGDEILQSVATRLTDSVRATDLSARYGGEEFVVIMPDVSQDLAFEVAERIRKAVEVDKFKISSEPGEINCTISVGMALFKDNEDTTSLLKRADEALYKAKEAGRNQVVVAE